MRPRRLATSAVVLLCGALAAPAGAVPTPYADISSAGRLTHVYVGKDLSCQVAYAGDATLEFFPSGAIPGDCGTFLATGPDLFAPDFANHPSTSALGSDKLNGPTIFTPVSQTPVTGAGTLASPLSVTTVADVPGRNLRLTETDSYVVGAEAYRTDVAVANTGGAARSGTLYRAGDCYLVGSDEGFGFTEGSSPGCSANANNQPAGRVEQWFSLTPGNAFSEGFYGGTAAGIWHQIGLRAAFNNATQATVNQDNGAGISWSFSVAAGASSTFSHYTVFSPSGVTGQPDFDPPSSAATPQTCSNSGVAVVVTDAPGGKGAAAVRYKLDGGAPQVAATAGDPGTASIPIPEGRHTLEYWGEDRAGNQEPGHHTISVVADHQAPVVAIASAGGRTQFSQGETATVAVTASDALSGLAADPSAAALPLSTVKAGTFTLTRTATDLCGNPASATFKYTVSGAATALGLPSAKRCVSRRNFRIRIRKIPGTTYRSVSVRVNSRRVTTRRGRRITAPVDLRGLPKGRFTVKITATLTSGRTISGSRTYRTCAPKRKRARL